MSLTVKGLAKLTGTLTKTFDQGDGSFPASIGTPLELSDGTDADQADLIFADTRSTTGEDLDLAGTLSDAFGDTITMARVKAIFVKASSDNTVDVHVGGAASNALDTIFADTTDKAVVRPGGALMFWAPDATAYAVTASTADLLTVAASDGATSVSYDIVIIGASA